MFGNCLQNDQMKTELKSRIIGVKTQMEYFHLFFGLNLGHRIFSHTDNQSKTLQAKKMSACNSKRLVKGPHSLHFFAEQQNGFSMLLSSSLSSFEQPRRRT